MGDSLCQWGFFSGGNPRHDTWGMSCSSVPEIPGMALHASEAALYLKPLVNGICPSWIFLPLSPKLYNPWGTQSFLPSHGWSQCHYYCTYSWDFHRTCMWRKYYLFYFCWSTLQLLGATWLLWWPSSTALHCWAPQCTSSLPLCHSWMLFIPLPSHPSWL